MIYMEKMIDNFLPLKTQGQEQESNSEPNHLQAANPEDQRASCLYFPGAKPPQAEAKNDYLKGEASQAKGITTPNGGVIKAPNGVNKIPTICLMGLKTALVANQDVSPEISVGPGLDPMTTTQEQENQVTNLIFLTNERTPGQGTISLPLNLSVQTT
ncbi:hypothetical protein DSO57_1024814 [Entomophthora muscae]|uniref:Uncharacterized protein n=1 Tax=Entomophthora muscae TaxID=34485 RepID=A0ACC2SRV4_9FUNG|nr:hypothetical protein DSO57_1024814 [Entomophthora muscae]